MGQEYGLILVHEPEKPVPGVTVDVVFVHGLFGKPSSTWTCKDVKKKVSTAPQAKDTQASDATAGSRNGAEELSKSDNGGGKLWAALTQTRKTKPEAGTEDVFWPRDLLPKKINDARVFTWGYDVDVDHLLSSAGQATIFQHAQQLAQDLADERTRPEEKSRKIIFVAHSLGGIVVKDMLSYANSSNTPHIKEILPATYGITFLGTPHRGTSLVHHAKIAYDITKVLGKNPATKTLSDLEINSQTLDRVSTYFKQLLMKHPIQIQTFREELPINGVMIVPPFSSAFEGHGEEVGTIHADHRTMTKFSGLEEMGFKRIVKTLERWVGTIKEAQRLQPPSAAKAAHLIPFDRDKNFQGRHQILQDLKTGFEAYNRMALHGLGGVGKSQIAIEYAHQQRESEKELMIFWVHGADANRFRASYRHIASILRLPSAGDEKAPILSIVWAYLSDPEVRPWLLILDNADDITVFTQPDPEVVCLPNSENSDSRPLRDYLPVSPQGRVLITSRSRAFALQLLTTQSPECLLEVPLMETKECVDLLLSKIPAANVGTEDERLQLVSELENLPIAISHAGAYINQNHKLTSVPRYLAKFRQNESSRLQLLMENIQDLRRNQQPNYSVLRTWDISFEHIQNTSPRSARLLFIMSVYSSQDIPEKLLLLSMAENEDLEALLQPLVQFHLVSVHASGELYDLHRFVQLATRTYLESVDELTDFNALALRALVDSLKDIPILPPIKLRFAYANYIPHTTELSLYKFSAQEDKNSVGQLLSRVALLWANAGDPWKGLAASQRAVDISAEILKSNDPVLIYRRAVLGYCLIESGAPIKGEAVLREMFAVLDKEADEDDWKDNEFMEFVLKYKNHLAIALERQGRFREAAVLARECLELAKAAPGLDRYYYFSIKLRLSNSLWQQHLLKDAEQLGKEGLEEAEESSVPRNFVLQFQRLLLNVEMQTKRFEDASDRVEELTTLVIREYGAQSFDNIMILHDKAILHARLERTEDALEALSAAESLTKDIYGDGVPHFILNTLSLKAECLEVLRRYEEALAVRERLYKLSSDAFGPLHIHAIRVKAAIAGNFCSMGHAKRGLDVIQPAIRAMNRQPSKPRFALALAMTQESRCYFKLGKGELALKSARKSVQLAMEMPSRDTSLEIICSFHLLELLTELRQFEEAVDVGSSCVQQLKDTRAEFDPELHFVEGRLASALEKTSQNDKAEELFKEMMLSADDAFGAEHEASFFARQSFGSFLMRQKRYDEAEDVLQSALDSAESCIGRLHRRTLALRNELGYLYRAWGKSDLAQATDRTNLELRSEAFRPDDVDVIQSMNNLAMVLWDDARFDEAASLLERAISLRTERFGATDSDVDFYNANLLSVLTSSGKLEAAEALYEKILKYRRELYGRSNTRTLETVRKGLDIWDTTKQWDKMKKIADETIAAYNKTYGENDHATRSVRVLISRAYVETGDFAKVEELLKPVYDAAMQGALTMYETGFFSLRYGFLLRYNKQYAEMEALGRGLMDVAVEHFGGKEDALSTPRLVVVNALQMQRKFSQAADLHYDSCAASLQEKDLTSSYLRTKIGTYLNLVSSIENLDEQTSCRLMSLREILLKDAGKTAGVDDLVLMMARVFRNQDYPESLSTLLVYQDLLFSHPERDVPKLLVIQGEVGTAQYHAGKAMEARETAQQAEDSWGQYEETHPEYRRPPASKTNLGYALISTGLWYEAECMAHELCKERTNRLGKDDVATIAARNFLGASQTACGRYEAAAATLRATYEQQKSKPGQSGVSLAITRTKLLEVLLAIGCREEAKKLLKEPYVHDPSFNGPRNRNKLTLQRLHAESLLLEGQVDAAETEAAAALAETKKLLGDLHPLTLRCIVVLAEVQVQKRGHGLDAMKNAENGLRVRRQQNVLHSPQEVGLLLLLGRILAGQNKHRESYMARRKAWMTACDMFRPDHPLMAEAERDFVLSLAKLCTR